MTPRELVDRLSQIYARIDAARTELRTLDGATEDAQVAGAWLLVEEHLSDALTELTISCGRLARELAPLDDVLAEARARLAADQSPQGG